MSLSNVKPPATVSGRALADDYDLVLVHEHLVIDLSWKAGAGTSADDLVLDDAITAGEELAALDGVRTLLVEVTPDSMGRDPRALAALDTAADVDIVMGGGPCILPTEDPDPRPPDLWTQAILDSLDRTDARQGVIGEVGTSDPITPAERNSLIGAIQAQAERRVPLHVYLDPFGRRGHEVLTLVERHGGDVSRTVLCHLDAQIPAGLDLHRELLDRGCLIGFDVWGHEGGGWPSDRERVAATVELVEAGYARQLLHSHDVCTKAQLKRFGGPGYDHMWRTVRPALADAGVGPEQLHDLLAGNALRLLSTTAD